MWGECTSVQVQTSKARNIPWDRYPKPSLQIPHLGQSQLHTLKPLNSVIKACLNRYLSRKGTAAKHGAHSTCTTPFQPHTIAFRTKGREDEQFLHLLVSSFSPLQVQEECMALVGTRIVQTQAHIFRLSAKKQQKKAWEEPPCTCIAFTSVPTGWCSRRGQCRVWQPSSTETKWGQVLGGKAFSKSCNQITPPAEVVPAFGNSLFPHPYDQRLKASRVTSYSSPQLRGKNTQQEAEHLELLK